MEEEELLTFAEIEALAAESSQSLHDQTGAHLPRFVMIPLQSERCVEYVPLQIQLPLGSLFYPCCGSDIRHAVASFASSVVDCHFADPYHPPLQRSRRAADGPPLLIPHVKTVVVVGRPEHKRFDNFGCPVYSHRKDGLLTLIDDVRSMSIFYYRGDSYGEGGSNQPWLEPVLFHTVLARLLDGGIVATDGSNCGSGRDGSVPWNSLCGGAPKGTRFDYAGRQFLCVGELRDSHRRNVNVWQVTAAAFNLQPE